MNKSQLVYEIFQAIAGRYDRINGIVSFGLHQAWRRTAVRELGITVGSTALDVCCGTGDLTVLLAQQIGPDGRVVGLDFSPAMLQQAKVKCRERRLSNVSLLQGDALALPFPDDSFHHVTMAFALRNVGDLRRALAEMRRVLAPGGRMLILDLSHPRGPLMRPLHACYLRRVLPWVAGALTGERAAYRWLPQSLQDFPDSDALLSLLVGVGLVRPRARLLLGGVAAIHIAGKSGEAVGTVPGVSVPGVSETGGVVQKGPSPLPRGLSRV